ncbi:hypothetical protein E2C01_061202 [Portunus trituberculatus]|uniref:Uncharacterized protein n=1 Tax=Portunus trituberculatus TaxID=210409 RepID=A0A5B7H7H6_PORTR|nr:hypothetical protein [Portunus trituberculatus]
MGAALQRLIEQVPRLARLHTQEQCPPYERMLDVVALQEVCRGWQRCGDGSLTFSCGGAASQGPRTWLLAAHMTHGMPSDARYWKVSVTSTSSPSPVPSPTQAWHPEGSLTFGRGKSRGKFHNSVLVTIKPAVLAAAVTLVSVCNSGSFSVAHDMPTSLLSNHFALETTLQVQLAPAVLNGAIIQDGGPCDPCGGVALYDRLLHTVKGLAASLRVLGRLGTSQRWS